MPAMQNQIISMLNKIKKKDPNYDKWQQTMIFFEIVDTLLE